MRHTLEYLLNQGLITAESTEKLKEYHTNRPLSIFWHVRTILYLGVTLLASGLGTLIYKNIDTIGHATIVIIIGLSSAICIYWCFKKADSFTFEKVPSPNTWLDYILLLGVSLFLIFEGYLQYQFNIFGNSYGLATILPALILFALAYRFDHLGVLSMGITLLATWLGISLTPKDLLVSNDFSDERIILAGLLLGVILTSLGYFLANRGIKKHFDFTYYNFAFHLSAFAVFGAAATFSSGWLWILLIGPISYLGYRYAWTISSFYFLLFSLGYAYAAVTYLLIKGLFWIEPDGILWGYLFMFYFIGTGLYSIRFLMRTYKNMTNDVRI